MPHCSFITSPFFTILLTPKSPTCAPQQKRAYLDAALVVEEDVVELNVAVQNALRVNVADGLYNLLEQVLRHVLLQLAPLAHVVEQVAARAHLHHEEDVLVRLERLVQPVRSARGRLLNDVRVASALQDRDLLHDLLLGALVFQVLLVHRLYRDELARQLVHPQIHLPKRALA